MNRNIAKNHTVSPQNRSNNLLLATEEINSAIICVDDEPLILNSLGEQLKRSLGQQYDIELVDSGAEAIALCEELTAKGIDIPVIICDQIMKAMTGDELLIELHDVYPHSLKILLTGQADAAAVGNLVNANALYRYVSKPWNETDLILTVKEALKCYQQERQLSEQNEALLQVNQQLKKSLCLLRTTLEATADGILVLDDGGKIIDYNQKFIDIWGLPNSLILDCEQISTLILHELAEPFANDLKDRYTQFTWENYDRLELKNGKIVECYSQTQELYEGMATQVWSFRDVTEHKKAQDIIQHQAFHDSLTDLPNRTLFDRELAKVLSRVAKTQEILAVMFLDLDRFKTINDTLGHAIGDALLKSVVARLKNCIRSEDIIARWGGDEFTLLLPQIKTREDASQIAERILTALKPSFDIEGHELHITSSIGIAVFPHDALDADSLLKNADAALYWVKERGRNNYQHYSLKLNSQAHRLLNIENNLHNALENQELVLYYQPIIETATNKIVKMEALLRWQHPELGLVPPDLFIPLAEENGLIIAIGEWVLHTACAQTKAWQEMGLDYLKIAINLSARQLYNNDLVKTVKQVLQTTELNPHSLELEMTETATMQNTALAKQILLDLNAMEISLSIDDFGTGYSSLSYLRDFPFHTLKIDRSFTMDLSVSSHNLPIINAIIALGKGLNLQIVAEGIESRQLKNLLETLECSYMQGFFFSPPVNVVEATSLLLQSANIDEIISRA